MEVYFKGDVDQAVEITTWNKAFRTARGVGPCTTVKRLKRAYGRKLKPSKQNIIGGRVYGYTLGKHLYFAAGDARHVTAVALYARPLPGGKALGYAAYVALNEVNCS
jgi:hypothetical protein